VRTSEKAPASSVIISTVSEVFLQNHCAGYLGHPFRKLAICTSLIFLSYHFPLVKDMELLREWRKDLWSSLNK
jgi:hypothetical protein